MRTLTFIATFFEELEKNSIRYVHWKSNLNLHNALLGEDDLDILVHPEDKEKLLNLFQEMQILRGYSEKDSWQDSVVHYYGLDIDSGNVVHIHLHFALPVGFDYNKNYVLPVVDAVLNNKVKLQNVFVPLPEYEYIILVIRIMVKNGLIPFLLAHPKTQLKLLSGKNVVTANPIKEFNDLRTKIQETKLQLILERDFYFIDKELFEKCESAILNKAKLPEFLKINRRLKKCLSEFTTHNSFLSFCLSFGRLNSTRLKTVFNKLKSIKVKGTKVPENGGRIFAFIGGDGAGKSTTIEAIYKIMARQFKTTQLHIGRPEKSFQGIIIRILYKLVSLINQKDLSKALQYLAIAYDRKKTFKVALKKRQEGCIVLQDRMPISSVTEMDCPRIHEISGGRFKRVIKREQRIYNQIKGIDKLFVLKLDPQIALQRRPEDNAEELLKRSGNIWNNQWEKPYMFEVNTGVNNQQIVIRKFLQEIWKSLATEYKRIEILGLNGTGKTTLIQNILQDYSNVTNVISLKRYPLITTKIVIKYFFSLGAFFWKYKSQKLVRSLFSLKVQLNILKKWEKMQRSNQIIMEHFVIDQGPAFGFVLANKEGYWDRYFTTKDLELINKFYNHFIILETPIDILYHRVKNRNQQVRSKELSESEFNNFCQKYITSFNELKTKTTVPYLEINTSLLSKDEVFEQVEFLLK